MDGPRRASVASVLCLHRWPLVSRNEKAGLVLLFQQPGSLQDERSLRIWLPSGGRNAQKDEVEKGGWIS